MKKIYAEWELYGEFYNEFFYSWDALHAALFNPDTIVKRIKVW